LNDAAVAAHGQAIAAGDKRGNVRFWDRVTGRKLGSVRAGRRAVKRVAFDATGRRLVSADADGTVAVWDAATQQRVATFHDGRAPADAALDPGGNRVATAGKTGTAVVRPVQGGGRRIASHASPLALLSVQFSPDGRRLLTASGRSARIWDADGGRLLERLDATKKFHFDCCFVPYPGAAFSPDGRRVAMVGTDGGLRVWDGQGALVREMQASGHQIINHAAFSRDGALVAAGGDDNSVHLIDARTGATRGRLRAPPDTEIARVGFSPDGTKVAGIASDGLTRVWDVRSGARLALLQSRAPFDFYRAEFSPDGRQIITSDGDTGIAVVPCLVCLSPQDMVALATGAAHRRLNAQERRVFLHAR
jgi:WD40 repeat protein